MVDLLIDFILWNRNIGLAWNEWAAEHTMLVLGIYLTLMGWWSAMVLYTLFLQWRNERRIAKEIEEEWNRICAQNL